MNSYNTYVLFLCAIVFVLFTATFSITITIIAKQKLKLIRCGQEDQAIKTEYEKSKKKSKVFNVISTVISTVFFVVLLTAFLFSIYLQTTEDKRPNGVPSLKVVLSGSMSFKNEKNEYLFKNELNNQIQTFDLVVVKHLPPENQLKLYDIVVYQLEDGDYVIHRIVKIEEPNEKHPDCRWFLLQGDAVSNADVYPVLYSQMQGIYMGQRIPFVGSFITFMQSPAGWFCILLVIITFIAMPILEKKIEKAKKLRLAILYPETETVLTEDEKVSVFKEIRAKVNDKTFTDKLEENPIAKDRYIDISALLNRVDGVRVIESKKARTYKCGNTALAKFDVKGKTLNAYIGLEPEEYQYTKYIFTDESSIKKHANYPMRVKVSSDRQQRWVKELLIEKINKEGLTLLEEQTANLVVEEQIKNVAPNFERLKNNLISKSFTERLEENPIAKDRYADISALLNRVDGVRVVESKKARTYKCGNTALAKFAVKGKTLNAYIGLVPQDYENTKYIFTDESLTKKHANYPMRVKVSSDRQQRWVKELLIEKINKENLTLLEMPKVVENTSVFASLKNKKASKSFKQKLKLSPVAKERFNDIKKELESIPKIRVIEGKNNITYKVKSLAVVRFAIKGKTLNAYLNLNPSEYKDTKYIFIDVSSVKKYANYPMRVKVSSDRQVKWVKELISQVLTKGDK